jgi:hypothetical protein
MATRRFQTSLQNRTTGIENQAPPGAADGGASVLFRLVAAPAWAYCAPVPGTLGGALTEAHVPTVGAPFTIA